MESIDEYKITEIVSKIQKENWPPIRAREAIKKLISEYRAEDKVVWFDFDTPLLADEAARKIIKWQSEKLELIHADVSDCECKCCEHIRSHYPVVAVVG